MPAIASTAAVASSSRTTAAWIALAVSLLLTVTAVYLTGRFVEDRAQERINLAAQDIRQRIAERMDDQYLILRAGVGLINASDHVSRNEWNRFVKELDLADYYPGIQGYGYSVVVAPDAVDDHESQLQEEGFTDYRINPAGEREFYTAIIYLEPFDWRNQRAFGYDMFSEVVRREAMIRAMETGQMTISGRVTLVQETSEDVQHGFLMYLPVYQADDVEHMTADQRRQSLIGFVYSPFRMRDLMRGILGKKDQDAIFSLYDQQADTTQLLFESHPDYVERTGYRKVAFSTELTIPFGGRTWLLHIDSVGSFGQDYERQLPWLVGLAGLAISCLLFLVLRAFAQQANQASQLATKLSKTARDTAARLQSVINTVEDCILIIDKYGLIETANPAVEKYFGYPENIIAGNSLSKLLVTQEDDQENPFEIEQLLPDDVTHITRARLLGETAKADRFPLEISVKALDIAGDQRYLCVMRDLTEQTRIDKLKNEFVSTISHELRTPLTAINATIGLMRNGVGVSIDENAHKMLDIAHNNCQRLTLLINDILDMEKLAAGSLSVDKKKWQIRDLMLEALEANRNYIERCDSRLTLDEPPPGVVCVDNLRLQQVFSNLLSNAAKFSPPQSEIRLTAEYLPAMSESDKPWVRFTVIDQGAGIPEAFREQLFERFAQADSSSTRQFGGSGLGLYITKQLVDLMGGRISYKCPDDGGTHFHVDFELAE